MNLFIDLDQRSLNSASVFLIIILVLSMLVHSCYHFLSDVSETKIDDPDTMAAIQADPANKAPCKPSLPTTPLRPSPSAIHSACYIQYQPSIYAFCQTNWPAFEYSSLTWIYSTSTYPSSPMSIAISCSIRHCRPLSFST